MERHEFSIESEEPILITLLGQAEGRWDAEFVGSAGDELAVRLEAELEVGTILKLETGDDLVLAEVSRCEPDGDLYRACLAVLESMGKSELDRLVRGGSAEEPSFQFIPEALALMPEPCVA